FAPAQAISPDALMADHGIVQKSQIDPRQRPCRPVTPTNDQKLTLLPDCATPRSRATVAEFVIHEEVIMTRWIAVLVAVFGLVGVSRADAQDLAPGPGTVVFTIVPGGATFFTEGKNTSGPSFGNYGLGGSVGVNFNRYIGVEGEVNGAL